MDQKLTWEKPGQAKDKFRIHLILALSRSGVCVTLQNSQSDYLFIANPLQGWSVAPDEIPDDIRLFGPILAAQLADLKHRVRLSGESGHIETMAAPERHFRFIVEPVASTGTKTDLMTTIIDVSEERRRETVLRTLLREVSHRSKNLLAIMQSIAAQTARHSDTIDQFLLKFRGRLYSLSLSQDLVTESQWRGARFRDLVHEQLQRYVPETAGAVAVEGDNILLSPNASMHIGLALHELIINAITHGALITRKSGIVVSCSAKDVDGKRMIELDWREELIPSSEPAPDDANSPHFGSAVLERVLPASVNGDALYQIDAEHVIYRLLFPADSADD